MSFDSVEYYHFFTAVQHFLSIAPVLKIVNTSMRRRSLLLQSTVNVPRRHLRNRWQRWIRLIQTYWRHCCCRWCAAAVTARIIVRCAVAWTIVVVIGNVLGSRSILRCSHYVISLSKVLPRSRLGCISERQASCINDAIVSY